MEDLSANTENIESAIVAIIRYIGDNPSREGLLRTPRRMIRAWAELFSGYTETFTPTVFEDGACKEMVILKNIEFYSTCEHHFLPFFGKAHIGYIPDGKVIGVSKLARLVDIYSRRLQIQERLTSQIADTLEIILSPKGVIVVLEAQHLCMMARGVAKQNSLMKTSAIRGAFTDIDVRTEFLSL
jgi:GTP cyclohydrolase I